MIGDKPPISGYDRYRSDFSKANAYPLLTRLARKTIASSIPALYTHRNFAIGTQPQPKSLTLAESSTPEKPATTAKEKCLEWPLPFPSYVLTILPPKVSSKPPPLQPENISHLPSYSFSQCPPSRTFDAPISATLNKGKAVMNS
uniref:Uncharacterized protein n=1 Tax=Cannabis sativa TaxID=3483 RepID=A0A803NRX9_CANSA